jgi:hypothetical protein
MTPPGDQHDPVAHGDVDDRPMLGDRDDQLVDADMWADIADHWQREDEL